MRQHRASDVECPGQKQRSLCLSRGALAMLIMAVDQVSGLSMSQLQSSDAPCEGQAHCSIGRSRRPACPPCSVRGSLRASRAPHPPRAAKESLESPSPPWPCSAGSPGAAVTRASLCWPVPVARHAHATARVHGVAVFLAPSATPAPRP